MLHPHDLPRDESGIYGRYRLRMGKITEAFRGAEFVDGVAEADGKAAERMYYAFGSACEVTAADDETMERVVAYLRSRGANDRADFILGVVTAPSEVTPAQASESAPEAPADDADEPEAPAPASPANSVEAIPPTPPVIEAPVDTIDDLDALRATAEALGVKVDGRWKSDRLKAEIRKARDE